MKRLFMWLMALMVTVSLSGMAAAQHSRGGKKPATTGLEHSETKANAHGQRGIENSEAKQAQHKKKHRKHRHSH